MTTGEDRARIAALTVEVSELKESDRDQEGRIRALTEGFTRLSEARTTTQIIFSGLVALVGLIAAIVIKFIK
jgi:hypothetical protein